MATFHSTGSTALSGSRGAGKGRYSSKGSTYIIDAGWDEIVHKTKQLHNSYVRVGLAPDLLEGEAAEGKVSEKQYSMQELVEHGIGNEYGVPERNIPSRPFMRHAIDSNKEELTAQLKAGVALLNTDRLTTKKFFWNIGKLVKTLIRDSIFNGSWAKNSERTKKQNPGEPPLLDTHQMVNSIRWKTYLSRSGAKKKTDGKVL